MAWLHSRDRRRRAILSYVLACAAGCRAGTRSSPAYDMNEPAGPNGDVRMDDPAGDALRTAMEPPRDLARDTPVSTDGLQRAYDPCPAAGTPCPIMPLGDSITYGWGSAGTASKQYDEIGGYRIPLFKAALDRHWPITFVGTDSNGPGTVGGMPFPRQHEGHLGFTIDPGGGRDGISPLVEAAMNTFKPRIVLLMIGTNDIAVQLDLANAPRRLGALLDKMIAVDPTALIVVAQIVPTTDDAMNKLVRAYNAAIPAVIKTRTESGKHVVLVDMFSPFWAYAAVKAALMYDVLHPNDAGYGVMADVWQKALAPLSTAISSQ